MAPKPSHKSGYTPQLLELARSMLLYVSTIIGDYAEDYVVAGGLVPTLLVPQDQLPEGADRHAGTRDLDLGFSLGLFDESRYQAIADRLRGGGFVPDENEEGNTIVQRWVLEAKQSLKVDFLIPLTSPEEKGGEIKHLQEGFGAVITPGLELAFQDRFPVSLSGKTPLGENANRDIPVCGPGAFVVLKALAFGVRGENKDAYDLYYVVRNYGTGPDEVAQHLIPLLGNRVAREAVDVLRRDFSEPGSLGPVRVANFMYGDSNDEIQADVVGFIGGLVRRT